MPFFAGLGYEVHALSLRGQVKNRTGSAQLPSRNKIKRLTLLCVFFTGGGGVITLHVVVAYPLPSI
jgi:hypothetical protein